MQDVVHDLLAKRRDRAIATILGTKERDCDQYLPRDVQVRLRKVVLDQINEYFELCCDVLRSIDSDGVVVNDLWIQKLDEIHAAVMGNGNGRE